MIRNAKFLMFVLFFGCLFLTAACKKPAKKPETSSSSQTAEPVQEGPLLLHEAAASGNVSWMRMLIRQGADPNKVNEEGVSPLEEALKTNRIRSIVFLLQSGANPKQKMADGTPLWVAYSSTMSPDIMRFMLPGDAGKEEIYQALSGAIAYNPSGLTVEYLLEAAQKFPDFSSHCFWPAALVSKNQSLVDSLLIREILPVDGCAGEKTEPPIVTAVKNGNEKLVASLLLLGADPSKQDPAGYTASYYALQNGNQDLSNQLVEAEKALREKRYAEVLARKRAAKRKQSGGCVIRKADGTTVPCPSL